MKFDSMVLLDDSHRPVIAGQKLGSGGEGTVYQLNDQPDRVLKLYHKPLEAVQIDKLRAMIDSHSVRLETFTAWPVSLVVNNAFQPVGFIMNLIGPEYKEVLHLYSPTNRKRTFPEADYSFIVHAAMNVAAAFDAIHAAGHIIGDVNQKNVLIDNRGCAALIDCDSFQISGATGQIYPCNVGVAEYTPPELHHKTFKDNARNFDHDDFGLAVIIFHLLFMGRHPFAGRYVGDGDPPDLNRAIAERMFPYAKDAELHSYVSPPGAVPMSMLSSELAQLFEDAFSGKNGDSRPDAGAWQIELANFKKQLVVCPRDKKHKHPSNSKCIWCNFAERGTFYFDSSYQLTRVHSMVDSQLMKDTEQALRMITNYSQSSPVKLPLTHSDSRDVEINRVITSFGTGCIFLILIAAFVIASLYQVWLYLFIGIFISLSGCLMIELAQKRLLSATFTAERARDEIAAELKQAELELKNAMRADAAPDTEDAEFTLRTYRVLHIDLEKEIEQNVNERKHAAEERFLKTFSLDSCSQLTDTDKELLDAAHIATAADLKTYRLETVRFLRAETLAILFAWKQKLLADMPKVSDAVIRNQSARAVSKKYEIKAGRLETDLLDFQTQAAAFSSKLRDHHVLVERVEDLKQRLAEAVLKLQDFK